MALFFFFYLFIFFFYLFIFEITFSIFKNAHKQFHESILNCNLLQINFALFEWFSTEQHLQQMQIKIKLRSFKSSEHMRKRMGPLNLYLKKIKENYNIIVFLFGLHIQLIPLVFYTTKPLFHSSYSQYQYLQ